MCEVKNFFENKVGVWQRLAECKKPIVLYGMGDGADKVLAAFEKFGITPSAVIASDDFVRGQSFRGFKVQKLSQAEEMLGEFVIALCFASCLPSVIEHIKTVAESHEMYVPSVPVFGDIIFDDKFIAENIGNLQAAYELMEDGLSRRVYKNILEFYHTGEVSLLEDITTPKSEAFENILKLGSDESYVDLGAYNGDTIDEFLHYSGGNFKKITALEPNAKNFAKLKAHCKDMKNTGLFPLGSYNRSVKLPFNNKAGRSSAIAEAGVPTRVAPVDSLLCGSAATYVKADVEGADFETLEGMRTTMRTFKPKLNFAAYHRFEDIFRLALYIKSVNRDYKIFLRHHPYIPAWDTNLYCI